MKSFVNDLIESEIYTLVSMIGTAIGFVIWCYATAYRKS